MEAPVCTEEKRQNSIEANYGLVWHVVKRFENRGYEREELFQVGMEGLIKAVDRFDSSYGVCFSTYAVPLIMGEIRRFLRDDKPVRVSRTIRENAALIKNVREQFAKQYAREPTVSELSELTGKSGEEIVEAFGAAAGVLSLQDNREREEGAREEAGVRDGGVFTVLRGYVCDEEKDRLVEHLALCTELGKLDEKKQELIKLRYFRRLTQSETARIMGMNQVAVSRLEKKILSELRENLFLFP